MENVASAPNVVLDANNNNNPNNTNTNTNNNAGINITTNIPPIHPVPSALNQQTSPPSPTLPIFTPPPLPNPKTHIRLLTISCDPITSSLSNPLSCTLATFPLATAPPYYALSYTWGDAGDEAYVLINGVRVGVRRNCEYVLRQAWGVVRRGRRKNVKVLARERQQGERQEDREGDREEDADISENSEQAYVEEDSRAHASDIRTTRNPAVDIDMPRVRTTNQRQQIYFWLDALCINQLSTSEKNHQVSLMSSIYASAELVYACIGPHTASSRYLDSIFESYTSLFESIAAAVQSSSSFSSSSQPREGGGGGSGSVQGSGGQWVLPNRIPNSRILSLRCWIAMRRGPQEPTEPS